MYRVRNSTHYSSRKVWATVEDGGNVASSIPMAKTKSLDHFNDGGQQARKSTKFVDVANVKSECCCVEKSPKQAPKKLKKLVKNPGEVVKHLYHYLRRLSMTNDQKINDIIERWNTKQADGLVPSVSELLRTASNASDAPRDERRTAYRRISCERRAAKHRKPGSRTQMVDFMIDPLAIQFMDRDYREAFVCHRHPEQRPDPAMQKAILASEIQPLKCRTQLPSKPQHDNLPFTPHNKVLLEILTVANFPMQRRYFVPHGQRGMLWIQNYLKGRDTTGILNGKEIHEREVSDTYVKRFRILFPGKVMFADTRVKRQVFKSIDMDLEKIFGKQKKSSTPTLATKSVPNYEDKEEVSSVDDATRVKCDKAVQVDFAEISEMKTKVDASVQEERLDKITQSDANNNNIIVKTSGEMRCQEDREQDNRKNTIIDYANANVLAGNHTKKIVGVKSDSEVMLDQNWLKDMLMGSFPKVKDTPETPCKASSATELVRRKGEKKNLLSRMKNWGRILKRKFSRSTYRVNTNELSDGSGTKGAVMHSENR